MRSALLALSTLPLAFGAAVPAAEAKSDYIVVLNHDSSHHGKAPAFQNTLLSTIQTVHQYNAGDLRGFSASLTASQAEALRGEPEVDFVERDGNMKVTVMKRAPNAAIMEKNSTWGLGRISHRAPGTKDYVYDPTGGEGTCAYIIDTGVQVQHPEFEGRATFVKNFDPVDGTDLDMFGHGTHVAGTIGSKTFGVAKKAKLFGIKVCNQLGICRVQDVIAGIDEAIQDSAKRDCPKGVVINMSLGDVNERWKSVDKAVTAATNAGVFVVVSAGNSFADSAKYSPASSPDACTVGATDDSDVMAVFSNYGKPVAVFAPGVDVWSTYSFNGSIQTDKMSGTSMASPHIAGLGAYLMAKDGKIAPSDLCKKIQSLSTKDLVTSIPPNSNTVNYLAFNGISV